MKIYADNAATTRVSDTALAAMTPCFQEIYGNPSSLHTPGQRAAEKLAAARAIFARNLHADPREITFTSGGSEADNQALRTAAALGEKRGKRHIVSTKFEHHAVLHTLQALEREGFKVTLLDDSAGRRGDGGAGGRDAIRPDTCLVSVMFANNEIGTIQPIAEIGAVCRAGGGPVSHGRGPGGRPPAHRCGGDAGGPAVPLRPQVPWAQGRGSAVRPAQYSSGYADRWRCPGAGQAGRHGGHPRHLRRCGRL